MHDAWLTYLQFLTGWTGSLDLPFHRFHDQGRMELVSCLRFRHRSRSMQYGRRWLQGQMVCHFPRLDPEYLQRVHQQLVEH